MHQVNIGQLQEPFSPNFEICFTPDYYLIHSHVLATYHIHAAALGNPQVVVQCSEDAGAGIVPGEPVRVANVPWREGN